MAQRPKHQRRISGARDKAQRAMGSETRAPIPPGLVARAIAIAASAHVEQVDRAGAPYVLHPLRMMLRAQNDAERVVAVLHDVLEDTPWTREQLAGEGFPEHILNALDRLTKRNGESYDDFIARVLGDPIAARVKLYDLEDNMDLRRLDTISDKDTDRMKKYHAARDRILSWLETRLE